MPFPDRRLAGKKLFEAESLRERDRYCGLGWHERSSDAERDYRNGFYERDYVTCFGTIRLLHCAQPREELPAGRAAALSAAGRGSGAADPGQGAALRNSSRGIAFELPLDEVVFLVC